MKYKVGDTVFHPIHGAGRVVEVKERRSLGSPKRYYSIELLCQPKTLLMVPVENAEEIGVRSSVPQPVLNQVWLVLRASPKVLPEDRDERYQLLRDQLYCGDILGIAAALRDMAWREQEGRGLTKQGKQLYDEGMMLLASGVAIAQESDYEAAEAQIAQTLQESMAPGVKI